MYFNVFIIYEIEFNTAVERRLKPSRATAVIRYMKRASSRKSSDPSMHGIRETAVLSTLLLNRES